MSETDQNPQPARPTPLGLYDKPAQPRVTGIEVVAVLLSALWLLASVVFFVVRPEGLDAAFDGGTFLMTMMAIFMPVAMIWVAATAARASRVMREESQRLQTAIDAIRQAYVTQAQRGTIGTEPSVARKLEEIAAATRKTETALATFTSSRAEPRRPAAAPAVATVPEVAVNQASLELGTPADALDPPLETEDFIRAMNFPETAEDQAGFAAMRRALRDRNIGQLVQAAKDVLTLLSEDGIYMDDLRPDKARPELWRAFANGARGREVAGLGGIRDRSSLALTAARMKQDPIFRDAAHHFLRKFDRIFSDFAQTASDAELSALAETRTARAFMLLGRVTGTFK